MAYLRCPGCGMTVFDRNPLAAPRQCPRCTARRGLIVELERIPRLGGAAAASLLKGSPAQLDEGEPGS